MSDLLSQLIRHRPHCYFISPHLDDAAFSAGGLMLALSGRLPLTVINVFTDCGTGQNTFSAQAYLRQCRHSRANRLYSLRRREDRLALSTIKAEVVNLGHTEALWRRSPRNLPFQLQHYLPEFGSLYPTYRFHITSGKIHPQDLSLSRELARRMRLLVNRRSAVVFCPLGIGNHVDHLLVKHACQDAFHPHLIFWSDFPYSLEKKSLPTPAATLERSPLPFPVDYPAKLKLCRLYQTQFSQVIKDPQSLSAPETYYLPHNFKL